MATENQKVKTEEMIMSLGEHKEIRLDSLHKFSIGNDQILGHKLLLNNNSLLIKGKRIGFTEVAIWELNRKKLIRVYVLSKKKYLNLLHLAQIIKSINLEVTISGPLLIITGVVGKLSNYFLLLKLMRENKSGIHLKCTLSKSLKNQIIGTVYKRFYDEFIDDIICKNEFIQISCFYSQSTPINEKMEQFLKDRYNIHLIPVKNQQNLENYRLKIKIIQIEKLDGKDFSLGPNHISNSLGDFFKFNLTHLIRNSQVILSKKKIHISTLAGPEIIIRPNFQSQIEVGASIPYKKINASTNSELTEWIFAGLKIDIILKPIGNKLQLDYQTSLSRPATNSQRISGSKESSSLIISLNHPVELFQIGYKTTGENTQMLPGLGEIPLIGNLFKSKSSQMNYKKISCIVFLEKV